MPFFSRQMLYSVLALHTLACTGATEYKNSCIPRIVQHAQYLAVLKPAPDYISLGWTRMNASRKQYAGVAEIPDRCHGRPSPLKSVEQQADRTLNLLVRIKNHPSHDITCKTNRRPYEYLSAACLVQNPALQSCTQDMEF